MLGSSSAGSETLKNLVLPGIGHFLIVDDHKITKSDVGNDFFVTYEDVGKDKAQVIMDNLQELNPEDSKGSCEIMSIADFVAQKTNSISESNLVILCDCSNSIASQVSTLCTPNNVPIISLR
jgi:amyloid beta precursor protein binding protein 1